jgi:hypothetical protein
MAPRSTRTSLRRDLAMQAAQRAGGGGKALIILHERQADAGVAQPGGRVGLREIAPAIAEPVRRDQLHLRQGQGFDLQRHGVAILGLSYGKGVRPGD